MTRRRTVTYYVAAIKGNGSYLRYLTVAKTIQTWSQDRRDATAFTKHAEAMEWLNWAGTHLDLSYSIALLTVNSLTREGDINSDASKGKTSISVDTGKR